jgi:hypothetical protein
MGFLVVMNRSRIFSDTSLSETTNSVKSFLIALGDSISWSTLPGVVSKINFRFLRSEVKAGVDGHLFTLMFFCDLTDALAVRSSVAIFSILGMTKS